MKTLLSTLMLVALFMPANGEAETKPVLMQDIKLSNALITKVDTVALVKSALLGSEASLYDLSNGGMDAIIATESVLDERDAIDKTQIQSLVDGLGHEKFKVRKTSMQTLSMYPEHMIPSLRQHLSKTNDPEIRTRLETVIRNILTVKKQISELVKTLHELYNKHPDDVIKVLWPKIKKDPFNMRALYALNHLPFDKTWQHFSKEDKDEQLAYLLLKVYCGDSSEAVTQLKEFSGGDVLRVAAATWWPIEIESPKKDGAYLWTTRAGHTKGNVAYNVIRMSIRGSAENPGGWIHLNRLGNVTYIFKYPVYVSRNVVVHGETIKALYYPAAWRNAGGSHKDGRRRIYTLRDAPATANLPFASLSEKERMDWTGHHAFKWAKPLFPPSIANVVMFRPNKYSLPEIRMPDKQASDQ